MGAGGKECLNYLLGEGNTDGKCHLGAFAVWFDLEETFFFLLFFFSFNHGIEKEFVTQGRCRVTNILKRTTAGIFCHRLQL